jgi:aminoglycoside phosphotransferase (APT) family kinase protein
LARRFVPEASYANVPTSRNGVSSEVLPPVSRFRIDGSTDRLRQYLLRQGYLQPGEPAEITHLGGGVSNDVIKVVSSGRTAVFKQALAKLRVEEEWFIDPERSNVEKDWLKLMRRILGPEHTPEVVFEDEKNYIFAMEFAPDGSEEWKTRLLRGEVDMDIARQAAWALARVHNETFEDDEVVARFDKQQRFVDCRVSPYFEAIARRHPAIAREIRSEIDRILVLRKVLVHGDYSPKNILISPDAAKVWVLDGEAAHMGDPTFDIAFLLNHFLLKAVRVRQATGKMLDAFFHIARTYGQDINVFPADWIEEHACRELGLLLLARVDGKSPVEYLTDEADKSIVRRTAFRIIKDRPKQYASVADILTEEIAGARKTA